MYCAEDAPTATATRFPRKDGASGAQPAATITPIPKPRTGCLSPSAFESAGESLWKNNCDGGRNFACGKDVATIPGESALSPALIGAASNPDDKISLITNGRCGYLSCSVNQFVTVPFVDECLQSGRNVRHLRRVLGMFLSLSTVTLKAFSCCRVGDAREAFLSGGQSHRRPAWPTLRPAPVRVRLLESWHRRMRAANYARSQRLDCTIERAVVCGKDTAPERPSKHGMTAPQKVVRVSSEDKTHMVSERASFLSVYKPSPGSSGGKTSQRGGTRRWR